MVKRYNYSKSFLLWFESIHTLFRKKIGPITQHLTNENYKK